MKNVGCSNESIRMQTNLMGDELHQLQRWSGTSPSFVIVSTTSIRLSPGFPATGNPFARHQTIAQEFIAEKKIDCGAAMLKSVETRFESQVSMTERVLQQKVFKALAKDALFLDWIVKQSRVIRLEVHDLVCHAL